MAQSCGRIHELPPKELARVAKLAVKRGNFDKEVWEAISARALRTADQFDAPDVALLLRAYSYRRLLDFNLFTKLANRLMALLDEDPHLELSAMDLTRIIYSAGIFQFADSRLFHRLVPKIYERRTDFRPKDLADIAHAFAKTHVVNHDLFYFVAHALPPYFRDLTPPKLANVCTAFAGLSLYERSFFDALTRHVQGRLRQFGAVELKNFFVGLAQIHKQLACSRRGEVRDDRQLIDGIIRGFRSIMGPLSFKSYLQILRGLMMLNHFDAKFLHHHLIPALSSRRHRQRADDITFYDFALLLSLLARLPRSSWTAGAAQLAQDVVSDLPRKIRFDRDAIVMTIGALRKLDIYDTEVFSKCEGLILKNRKAFMRGLRYDRLTVLQAAYEAIAQRDAPPPDSPDMTPDDNPWRDIHRFLTWNLDGRQPRKAAHLHQVPHPEQQPQGASSASPLRTGEVFVHTYSAEEGFQTRTVDLLHSGGEAEHDLQHMFGRRDGEGGGKTGSVYFPEIELMDLSAEEGRDSGSGSDEIKGEGEGEGEGADEAAIEEELVEQEETTEQKRDTERDSTS